MDRGYIKLWRKIWENPVLKEPNRRFSRYEAWIYLVSVEARGIEKDGVGRGEFQASIRYLGGKWNWSNDAVFRFLRILERENMISRPERQPERQPERFIICNYELYNAGPNAERNTKRNKVKEGFNKGIKEKGISSADAAVDQAPSSAFMLAEKLRLAIAVRDPKSKAAMNHKLARDWTPHFEKILSLDRRSIEECESVIAWCQQRDCFWGPVILGGKKFREKFDTMWGQMKRNGIKPDTIGSAPESVECDQSAIQAALQMRKDHSP